jgi:hypothetical protein
MSKRIHVFVEMGRQGLLRNWVNGVEEEMEFMIRNV